MTHTIRRRIICIDEEKCTGCGLCVSACHEGAIGLKNGKAVLLRDDYCDGLGDCLPACPEDAITFVEREALPYDEAAVLENMAKQQAAGQGAYGAPGVSGVPGTPGAHGGHGCPGSMSRELTPLGLGGPQAASGALAAVGSAAPRGAASALGQWPVQLKLVPERAPYFSGAEVLVAADCTAFAHGSFHESFMRGKVTLIGCPKLDSVDYAEKLAAIFSLNDVASVTVVKMSVPCCRGLEVAVREALGRSGKNVPLNVVTLTPEGGISPA